MDQARRYFGATINNGASTTSDAWNCFIDDVTSSTAGSADDNQPGFSRMQRALYVFHIGVGDPSPGGACARGLTSSGDAGEVPRYGWARVDGAAYPNGVEPKPAHRARHRMISYDAEAGPQEFSWLEQAVDESQLVVPIAATYPLDRAADAHAHIERGHVLGRIVLAIRGEAR